VRQRQEEKKLKEDGKTKEKKRKPYTYIPGVARPVSIFVYIFLYK